MLFLKRILNRRNQEIAPFVVIAVGLSFLFVFAGHTFGLPLLADHCKKTTKSVEVAYNLARYGDFYEYDDWKATPLNPRGKQGIIFRYESPLSALLLGAVYRVVDAADFEVRLSAARIFTLIHLTAAYLLFAVFIFRRELWSLTIFTFLMIASTFTVSYATKPLAETYALFYQALLMVAATHLLSRELALFAKAGILAGLTALLCAGGKMNYFIAAFPLMVGYPFLDRRVRGIKGVTHYFAPFVIVAGLGVAALLLFTKFSFYNAFVYMIRGNKPILDNSLWATFMEGFDYWPTIVKRTRADFGAVVFDWGRISLFYIAARFGLCLFTARKRPALLHERFTFVLFLLILGHALNYVVLRNLFIPHRYYVVPIYTIFCLSITMAAGDIVRGIQFVRQWGASADHSKSRFTARLLGGIRFMERSAPWLTVVAALTSVGAAAWYFAVVLASPSYRTTAVYAMKGLGHGGLAIEIGGQLDFTVRVLGGIRTASLIAAACTVVWMALSRRVGRFTGLRRRLEARLHLPWTAPLYTGIAVLFLIPGGQISLQNARSFYEYAFGHVEAIEAAEQLAQVRRDTVSGDLVLAWKPCYAFYADKRSILEPRQEDLSFYRKNGIHSIMGPVKPFNNYYKKIDKYPPPMTYWAPKPTSKGAGAKSPNPKQKK